MTKPEFYKNIGTRQLLCLIYLDRRTKTKYWPLQAKSNWDNITELCRNKLTPLSSIFTCKNLLVNPIFQQFYTFHQHLLVLYHLFSGCYHHHVVPSLRDVGCNEFLSFSVLCFHSTRLPTWILSIFLCHPFKLYHCHPPALFTIKLFFHCHIMPFDYVNLLDVLLWALYHMHI